MIKKMVAIGDSITRGTYTAEGDWCPLSVASPNFAQLIKETLGYDELINYGSNGVTISATVKAYSETAISKKVLKADSADMAIVAGGTNDYGNNVVLGNFSDELDVSFYGALEILFKALKQKYKKIYVITPIRRITEGKNAVGHTLEDYRLAIERKAKQHGLCVIDGYQIPINPKSQEDKKKYILDGLHPNTEGHKLYAEYVIERIKLYESGRI